MSLDLTPLSELDAVNTMLECVGENPVNSLENGNSFVAQAQSLLHRTSREVQKIGLHCNTRRDTQMYPDSKGLIYLPLNTLKVSSKLHDVDIAEYIDPTTKKKSSVLFDIKNNSFVWKTSPKIDIVAFVSFETLPQHVRDYITIKAARKLQARKKESQTEFAFSQQDETEAKVLFEQKEAADWKCNLLKYHWWR